MVRAYSPSPFPLCSCGMSGPCCWRGCVTDPARLPDIAVCPWVVPGEAMCPTSQDGAGWVSQRTCPSPRGWRSRGPSNLNTVPDTLEGASSLRGRTGPAPSWTLTISASLVGLPPPYLPFLYLPPAPLHLDRWSQVGRALSSCTSSPALTPPESHEHWAHHTLGNAHLGCATHHIRILLEEGPTC